jgi:hypothetical protein
VKTEYGQGRVINSQILTQLVLVEHGDGRKIAVGLESLEIIGPPQSNNRQNGKGDIKNSRKDNNENGSKDSRKKRRKNNTKDGKR